MGTRGFVGFVAEGREALAYNHSDSYPGGLGDQTLNWLRSANLDIAAQAAPMVRLVSDAAPPTDAEIEALKEFCNPNVGGRSDRPTWYQLLRETQGDLGAMIRAGYMEDAGSFPLDSLFCEWGYLVDFDQKRFEVYTGLQHAEHAEGRFARRGYSRDGYWPVRLVASWPLSELPDDDAFYAATNGDAADSAAS